MFVRQILKKNIKSVSIRKACTFGYFCSVDRRAEWQRSHMVTIMWARTRELPFIVCVWVKCEMWWGKKQKMESEAELLGRCQSECFFVEKSALRRCGDEASGYRCEHKRTWRIFGFVTESERAGKSKKDSELQQDWQKQAENTGHCAKEGGC